MNNYWEEFGMADNDELVQIYILGGNDSSFTQEVALACLELAAPSLGLGSCWAGYFYVSAMFFPPMKEALQLPEGNGVYGAMMVGYPKYKYHRIPTRKITNVIWR